MSTAASRMRVNSLLLEAEQILAATDVQQLAQATSAAGKLQEIHQTLNGLKGSGQLRAVERQEAQVKIGESRPARPRVGGAGAQERLRPVGPVSPQ